MVRSGLGNRMNELLIGRRRIGPGHPTFIIAEAGLNHNGDPALAARLIECAAQCGADAIKFQTYQTQELFQPDHADYQQFKRMEFSSVVYQRLFDLAQDHNIILLSTPFDEGSADLLDSLGIAAFKVGSGEVTHLHFLEHLARKGIPIMLSTGMSSLEQVGRAVEAIQKHDAPLALLHCVSSYPCPLEEANLRIMDALAAQFNVPVGYSDHTTEDIAPVAAVGRGACIIEKHFTLSQHLPGWDHFFSYPPESMTRMVNTIRQVEIALGSNMKSLRAAEHPIETIARRSIYTRRAISTGETFTHENLVVRRPLGPLSADRFQDALGKQAPRDLPADAPLLPSDLE